MLDYSFEHKRPCNQRLLHCRVPAVLGKAQLETIIKNKPDAKIIRTLSHSPGKGQEIRYPDGTPYLDEFGLAVYLLSDLDWEGTLHDTDLRYAGTSFQTSEVFNAYDPTDQHSILRPLG